MDDVSTNRIIREQWRGCYEGGWKGLIVDEAFAHPAKFSYALISRIVLEGLKRGWWDVGDTIGDPFGGVGLGGLVCAYNGLRWFGAELEQNFVDLAEQNFTLHKLKWENAGDPLPIIVQGDSRRFAEIVGNCDALVTSPPYISGGHHPDQTGSWGGLATIKGLGTKEVAGYGQTPGQIGRLPPGDLRCDGIVTSPPYMRTNASEPSPEFCLARGHRRVFTGTVTGDYGESPGQIGKDSGETYWQAMRQVYSQCLQALKPGGYLVVVVKDYVKGGKKVRLCRQTRRLLHSLGFKLTHRIRAWLVKEHRTEGLYGEIVDKTERKSFFRRLAESKGSPPIDWEEVIVALRQEDTNS